MHLPVILIQREPRKTRREFLFLVGRDLEGTHKAYEILANLMKGTDRLEVLLAHERPLHVQRIVEHVCRGHVEPERVALDRFAQARADRLAGGRVGVRAACV